MSKTGEGDGSGNKRSAMWMAVAVTVACVVLAVPAVLVAGFTLWGIGELGWPPPFARAPHIWVMNTISLVMPALIIAVLVAVWVSYVRGAYRRTRLWALVLLVYSLCWLPGPFIVWS